MLGPTRQLYWHREWIIPPGAHLFVLGEVEARGPRVSLRRPAHGPHIISTLSPAKLRRRTALAALAGVTLAPAAAVVGATLLIVHFG
jgi:hypothetical protein